MAPDRTEAASEAPDPDLDATVARLLGRRPQGDYAVAVSRPDGEPVVLVNAPFLHSGRPMPTRYWLIDPALNKVIGQLESTGGVKQAEAAVDPDLLAATHERYGRERDRLIPSDHTGPAPSGGVGGTRQGVKCLHAHYAHHLAGGDDPVGRWVHERLRETGELVEGLVPSASASVAERPSLRDADRLGSPLEILDGTAEAELGYRAEVGSADPPGAGAVGGGDRLVTFDIGYGSTELATVVDGRISAISLPIGAATVTAAHLHSDPPDPAELSAALSVIELHLDDVVREMPELAAAITDSTIVGLGAVRFVAEVELGVADGDEIDGCVLERDAAEELFRALATESHEDRAANPGLQPDHVGWIVGAMCILLEFMRRFAVDEIRVSTLGLLDGVAASIEAPTDFSPKPTRDPGR